MKTQEIITQSAEETQAEARRFMKQILPQRKGKTAAEFICLWGDLGSGKTTFAQGLARELGIKDTVNSPTFLIMKKYLLSGRRKHMSLYHFDLYRIQSKSEILDLGWEEILGDKNNLVVVEWPEKIADILPPGRTDIKFSQVSPSERRIVFYL